MIEPIENPIFIIGTGRSGTTLLRMMLNAHPAIYISNEASYYLVAQKARSSGEWLDSYRKIISYRWMKFPAQDVEQRVPRDLPKEKIHQAFDTLMRIKADQYGKRHYGDKTPTHALHVDRILRDFPKARIVHIVRDPVATVASMKHMPWMPQSVVLISLMLAAQMRKVRNFHKQILEIRLEDLLASPESVLRKVLDYIEEDWDDKVLHHQDHAPQDDMPPFPWFVTAKRKASPTAALTLKRFPELSDDEKLFIEFTNRATLEQFGYAQQARNWRTRLAITGCVLKDIPLLCRDIARAVPVTLRLRTARTSADLLWIDQDAWKYFPEFKIHEVTHWESR